MTNFRKDLNDLYTIMTNLKLTIDNVLHSEQELCRAAFRIGQLIGAVNSIGSRGWHSSMVSNHKEVAHFYQNLGHSINHIKRAVWFAMDENLLPPDIKRHLQHASDLVDAADALIADADKGERSRMEAA